MQPKEHVPKPTLFPETSKGVYSPERAGMSGRSEAAMTTRIKVNEIGMGIFTWMATRAPKHC